MHTHKHFKNYVFNVLFCHMSSLCKILTFIYAILTLVKLFFFVNKTHKKKKPEQMYSQWIYKRWNHIEPHRINKENTASIPKSTLLTHQPFPLTNKPDLYAHLCLTLLYSFTTQISITKLYRCLPVCKLHINGTTQCALLYLAPSWDGMSVKVIHANLSTAKSSSVLCSVSYCISRYHIYLFYCWRTSEWFSVFC